MPLSGFLARLLGEAGVDWACRQGSKGSAGTSTRQGPHPAGEPMEEPSTAPSPGVFYLRSFWLRKPSFIFSTTLASMELASLAKSRSRISDTGTETMAKASLSSLVGHVPSWEGREKQCHTHRAMPGVSPTGATTPADISDSLSPPEGLGWAPGWCPPTPLDHPECFSPWVLGGKEHPKSFRRTGNNPQERGGSRALP